MKYRFTLDADKILCNGQPLKYVYQPTHKYIHHVLANGSTTVDYTSYDDEKESYYAYDPWTRTRVPKSVVEEAIATFEKGFSAITIQTFE